MNKNNKKTILLADDSYINRVLVKEMLKDEYNIIEAGDGVETLEILNRLKNEINLIVLDLTMPKKSGFEVLDEVGKDPVLKEIPIIIMTSSDSVDTELKTLEAGATDFFTKPIEPRIAYRRIKSVLEQQEAGMLKLENDILVEKEKSRKNLENMLERIECGIAVYEVSQDGSIRVTYINEPACKLTGCTKNEYKTRKDLGVFENVHEDDIKEFKEKVYNAIEKREKFEHIFRIKHKNRYYIWAKIVGNIFNIIEDKIQYIATFMNIDEEVRNRESLRYQAEFDKLTGIYNKETFYKRTEELIKKNLNTEYILLRFNIEKFKLVNSVMGVLAGDTILKLIAKKLKERVEKVGVCGRFEADNFVICVPKERVNFRSLIPEIKEFFKQFKLENNLAFNIGAYEIKDVNVPVNQMCDYANLAITSIKGNYEREYSVYNENMEEILLIEQEIRNEMKDALEQHQFQVYLQPLYNSMENIVVSAEALVRWNHPKKGMISPAKFIPVFEKNGFISELDYYVWEETCKILQKRQNEGRAAIPISVNASRKSLYNPKFCERIFELSKKYNIPHELLKIEITETAYMDNATQLLDTVMELQKNGYIVLMDDFGSGYSSLNTLKDIPVDILKIDMKFLEGFEKGGRIGTVFTSIIRMAKWLGISVVAEGVETVEQLDFLRSVGCENIQGYYYARPMPYSEFEEHVLNNTTEQQAKLKLGKRHTWVNINQKEFDAIMGGSQLVDNLMNSVFGAFGIYMLTGDRLEAIRVNKEYYNIMEHSVRDFNITSKNIWERYDTEEKNKAMNAFKQSKTSNAPVKVILKKHKKDGGIMNLNIMTRYLGGDESNDFYCVACINF